MACRITKTIRQLKDALYTVDIKAKKSYLIDLESAKKALDLPPNERFLILIIKQRTSNEVLLFCILFNIFVIISL